ncbi:glycoside hydrolase family 2 TIM barrel-domain containing protein [uncultured Algibacter sp.]|uniref:glycoside hydrolase family 2 protein n=1 Tax=uncultured Algibacter sp. TaxID=298659 RepID=UPI002634752D|nr:glycoside hydrolase family 2 TIM barrel-domain containing protein [uncultured Algibacter sp.]
MFKGHFIAFFIILTIQNFSFSQELPFGFPDTDRTKKIINQDWKFQLGHPDSDNYKSDLDDSNWETVTIPHTLKLTSLTLDGLNDKKTQLLFHRTVGWYRKHISVSDSNKKVFLEFEGAHQVTDLWVNGKHVGQYGVGGYTPFHFDITSYVERGKINQVTLLCDNRRNEIVPPDPGPFDYVKFSGLYRDVYLVETNPIHVTFNWESLNSGVNITIPTIDPVNKNATINIKTSVKNEGTQTQNVKLATRIIDKEGIVIMKLIDNKEIPSGIEYQFNQIGSLEDDVKFWDIDNPYLYRINSVIIVNDKNIDFVENKIGLRKFELDPEKGFILNNKPIELIGFNRHQQYPYIGDAVPNSLHYKDMLQFKEFGFNIMRTAHYPQDDALIEACDELGILVYEEAPTWISMSQKNEWWDNLERSARTMVRNHRNHPSIVMWGAGVNHRGYVPRVHNTIKQEDPIRLTASQGARWTGWQASGLTDINANMLYGPFLWDRSEPIFAMEGGRGAAAVAPYKKDPMMTGLISWTAHAYYTFHPSHDKATNKVDRTRSGMMTIFRFPRPEFEWYKSELVKKPFIHIEENWNPETSDITVFSNADEVELLLNGEPVAKNRPSQDTIYDGLEHPPFHFKNTTYAPGILKAKGYFKDGKPIETQKQTPGKPYALQLKLDTLGRDFVADGNDILMAYATVVDKNGTPLFDAKNLVTFSVKGDGSVVGDSANINANPMFTEHGVAPALIRAGNTSETITVFAKSKGLKSAKTEVTLVPNNSNYIQKNAKPIYDFARERVDIGASDQLTQFGWDFWNGTDEGNNLYQFKAFTNVTATLTTGSSNGIYRWLGEMNVIGKYGFAYADGVIAIDKDGLNLTFNNLPEGTYKLKTWHHAPRSNSDSMDPNKDKLKGLTIHKLPYKQTLKISSKAMSQDESVQVTAGEQMQWELPGMAEFMFSSDGKTPVIINFNGEGNKGIWLNAFELSKWK